MVEKQLSQALVNFLRRVSLDREVRDGLERMFSRSRLASDVTSFANSLGYVFSEEDLRWALRSGFLQASERPDGDIEDAHLDPVVGGVGQAVLSISDDVRRQFERIEF